MNIRKTNGQIVPFDEEKVRNSIRRTGVREEVVGQVMAVVKKSLKPKISTKELYKVIREELAKIEPWAAARYNLREALIRLGPAGFNFEKYVAAILNAYGYKTKVPKRDLRGACIPHEIDVTAEKEGRSAFIEAKFRRDFSAAITIKDTLATWARYLDLVDGSKINQCPHFDEAWIVTNARFTDQSLKYGHCKNMVLIGWNHPKERTFANMVDLDSLYPITIIENLTQKEMQSFADADIILCREVCDMTPSKVSQKTGISAKRIEELVGFCNLVVNGEKIQPEKN